MFFLLITGYLLKNYFFCVTQSFSHSYKNVLQVNCSIIYLIIYNIIFCKIRIINTFAMHELFLIFLKFTCIINIFNYNNFFNELDFQSLIKIVIRLLIRIGL